MNSSHDRSNEGGEVTQLCTRCGRAVTFTAAVVEQGHISVVCHICHLQWQLLLQLSRRQVCQSDSTVIESALAEVGQFLETLPLRPPEQWGANAS